MTFLDRLREGHEKTKSIVCLGIDPDIKRIPIDEPDTEQKIVRFVHEIIDAVASQGIVSTIKPNYAFFAQHGFAGLRALRETIEMAKEGGMIVILDAKRGDIANTASAYAKELFEFWEADAVTLSPYMGRDSIDPFLRYCERGKGVYVLAKTSNPGSKDIQDLEADGAPIFSHVIDMCLKDHVQGTGFVVGATNPLQLASIQGRIQGKGVPLLIPGVGSQGGSVKETIAALNHDELGMHRINSSSSILYAHEKSGEHFVTAALNAIKALDSEIQAATR